MSATGLEAIIRAKEREISALHQANMERKQ